MLIDTHTHIIPYVDDGAENWEAALTLLKQGEKEGIVAALATPHILNESDYKYEQEITKKFLELKQRAKDAQIKMKLFLGCELYLQSNMTLNHKISTVNQKGKHFLVELPMTNIPRFTAEKFFDHIVDGKIPIIAHPERNVGFMNSPMLAYEFVQRGALMQINAPSILGKHGDKARILAFQLISYNLAHFVGSDCHHPNHRSMALKEAYNVVVKTWGRETADRLFYKNSSRLLNGEDIEHSEPIPIEEAPKRSLWQRIINFKLIN